MSDPIRNEFLLDPDVVFLNHGSFGACPRPVFEAYQRYQRELEWQPIDFLGRRRPAMMAAARGALATFLGVDADEVVYFTNPTTAINMVARSVPYHPDIPLGAGDEILTTDHEYGAMDRTWRFVCQKVGAHYVQRHMPLPVTDHASFVEEFWTGVNERTRIIFLSHITSPTALIFPVAEICRRAHAAGILTIVDGAHAPSQIPLNLRELGVDIYTGACHKWLCAPKGSAFLYTRRELQGWLEPLVVSFGWESNWPGPSRYIDYHEWQGTRDIAAFLAVPDAIEFQAEHDWPEVRERCHALATQARQRIQALTGLAPICPESGDWYSQMVVAPLPATEGNDIFRRLYDEYHIVIAPIRFQDLTGIRLSFQAYNDQNDLDRLVDALVRLLPKYTTRVAPA